MTHPGTIAVWATTAATLTAIMWRPFRIGEWIWAVAGSAALLASGALSGRSAAVAALDGSDVYLFLAGMLALAELARVHGVFEWIAAKMLAGARGEASRLFARVYVAGIIVTALLSNDGTIVLLTPAVLALTKRSRGPRAPYLYACAFIANAASFLLPISNPANLVVFRQLPKLGPWLTAFALPSFVGVALTFLLLRYLFRRELATQFAMSQSTPRLTMPGRLAMVTVTASAAVIIAGAGMGLPVGRVAFACGALSLLAISFVDARTPKAVLREAPWSIIPLVAGLFVVVRALDETGVLQTARAFFRNAGAMPAPAGHLLVGAAVMLADNALNNLPIGVLARYSLNDNAVATHVMNATLIGVDLGPNLSLTGSLATLLWVMMLRRDGIEVNPWRFLGIGAIVTIPALALASVAVR